MEAEGDEEEAEEAVAFVAVEEDASDGEDEAAADVGFAVWLTTSGRVGKEEAEAAEKAEEGEAEDGDEVCRLVGVAMLFCACAVAGSSGRR